MASGRGSLWRYIQVRLLAFLFRLPARISALFYSHKPAPSRKLYIPSSNNTHLIQLQIYDPLPTSSRKGPRPVHITFHGSGFVIPQLGENAPFCSLLVRELGCIVVDADYLKAPENPFPAAFDDAMSVVEWVRMNHDGQFDTSRISTGGFSAGGNLALAVCGQLPAGTIKGVTLFYPSVDFTVNYPYKRPPPAGKWEAGIVIPIWMGTMFRDAYAGDYPNMADPRLSPWLADVSHFPASGNMLLVTCEFDYLRGEVEDFVRRLKDAGNDPVYMEIKGQGHGWCTGAKDGTDAGKKRDEAWAKAVEVLRRAYAD